MRRITKIDIKKSVSKRKLIFHQDLLEIIDRILVYVFSLTVIIYPLLVINELTSTNSFSKYFATTALILMSLFGCYLLYRKVTEKKLTVLSTNQSPEGNRLKILEFGQNRGMEIFRSSKNCIILLEPTNFGGPFKKSSVFILNENEILFTVLKDSLKLNVPTLFSHLSLKRDLKKHLTSEII